MEVTGGAAVQDFEGVWLDPTATTGEGAMMRLNAPDESGFQRKIRPGKTVTLDGIVVQTEPMANVRPGEFMVEQPPRRTVVARRTQSIGNLFMEPIERRA